MVHIDEEEIIDLVVGLLLLLFASLMIGYCMARIARSDDDDDDDEDDAGNNGKNSVCCGLIRKNSSLPPPREFTSLNELLVEVDDHDERGKLVVVAATSSQSSTVSDTDTDRTKSLTQCFTLDSVFPNILQVKEDNKTTNGSLEEPLLRDS